MLATTRCPLATAIVVVAMLCRYANVAASGGSDPNRREKRQSLLPTQRMAVVGLKAAASARSVGPGLEQLGFRISAAITRIGLAGYKGGGFGGQVDASPTIAPTVNPGTATSRVCCVFSRGWGTTFVTTA